MKILPHILNHFVKGEIMDIYQKIRIGETKLNLLNATKADLGLIQHKCVQSTVCNFWSSKYTSYDDYRTPFTLEIDILSNSRRNSEQEEKLSTTEDRFNIRLNAFNLLTVYWDKIISKSDSEMSLRSSSPLRYIFEAQEKYIFGVPQQKEKSPMVKITVSDFQSKGRVLLKSSIH